MTGLETISLKELLRRHWNTKVPDLDETAAGLAAEAETQRQRELRLRRWLPGWLLRLLDSSFARSNTVHPETARALYAICRASKARHVFETGTYWGYSTAWLASAVVAENGTVWTFDLDPHAGQRIPEALRRAIVQVRGKSAEEAMPEFLREAAPDLFFQDSLHDYHGVAAELRVIAPYLSGGAVCLFHDFVVPGVRQAASDCLPGFVLYRLALSDPQELGVALKPR